MGSVAERIPRFILADLALTASTVAIELAADGVHTFDRLSAPRPPPAAQRGNPSFAMIPPGSRSAGRASSGREKPSMAWHAASAGA